MVYATAIEHMDAKERRRFDAELNGRSIRRAVAPTAPEERLRTIVEVGGEIG